MSDLSNASLMDLFRTEVEQHVAALNDGLMQISSGNSSRETLNALMRAAHSIKGAARIVGVQSAVDLAHAMEDCFVSTIEGKSELHADRVDTMLKGVDLLSRMGHEGQLPDDEAQKHRQQEIAEVVAALGSTKFKKNEAGHSHAHPESTPANPEPAARKSGLAMATSEPAARPATPYSPVVQDLASTPLIELFRTEVQAQCETLLSGIAQSEIAPPTTVQLEDLRRAAHSIKGAARIIGLNSAVDAAYAIEQHYESALNGKAGAYTSQAAELRRGVDLLQRLAQNPASVSAEEIAALRAKLAAGAAKAASAERAAAGRSGTSTAITPPPSKQSGKTETTIRSNVSLRIPAINLSEVKSPKSTSRLSATVAPDRAVRVNAISLNRLMGLAGEYRVETRWLEPFAGSLRVLKNTQLQLVELLDRLETLEQNRTADGIRFQMLNELNQQRVQVEQRLSACIADFEQYAYRADNLAERLYREVIASRMRPFADGVQGFPRLIHDLAKKLNKKVRFEILGKTTGVDRDILDKLEAPLNHLLRNALDHGIESPEERTAAGKRNPATITLEASHKGGMLAISISDDGRGIDLERLRQTIEKRKLAAPDMIAKMSEAELLDFLFLPGFSTASAVTEISGRGVGLDVVQTMVQETGGQIRIVSTLGKGTSFHLQLPITLSVLRALLVEIAGEPYAFPLARIDRIVSVPRAQVRSLESRQYLTIDGQNVGLVSAHQVLDFPESPNSKDELSVVVVAGRTERYGLTVGRFIGEREVVVRPLDARLGRVRNVSAAALMEDGAPLLILDVEDIIHSIDTILSGGRLQKIVSAADKAAKVVRKRILVVDDSLTVREVERKLLENKGYEVDVAADGMDGWHAVRSGKYDLVISDVDMPRMNGIEFVSHIKHDARLKHLPVMIVSYKDREEDRLRGLEAGANYYLAKSSFHDESLTNAVLDLIGAPTGERTGRSSE